MLTQNFILSLLFSLLIKKNTKKDIKQLILKSLLMKYLICLINYHHLNVEEVT